MKRDPSLASLSRDHHHALTLAQALKRDAPTRLTERLPSDGAELVAHVRDRFERELEPHFQLEERELVPRCESEGEPLRALARQVVRDHEAMRSIVAELASDATLGNRLDDFARRLEEHVRFEERSWFVALEAEWGSEKLAAMAARLRPLPMARIAGYEQDEEGVWVAILDCGHRQHVRHDPPWQTRLWVGDEAGRREHLGQLLPCPWCRMSRLPPAVEEYKRTNVFEPATTPAGLQRSHTLKAEAWGEIVVLEGRVLYVLEDDNDLGLVLTPTHPGVVAPNRPHHVTPQPGSRFFVRFLRRSS